MRIILGTVLLFLAKTAHAGCFTRHLVDAIHLNRARGPVYSEWSDGRSKLATEGLILFEKSILPLALLYDGKARKWQKQGIPVLCADLIDMARTPPLPAGPTPHPEWPEELVRHSGKDLSWELKDAYYAKEDMLDFQKKGLELLHRLEALPGRYCLVRHFVESVTRTSSLAPRYMARLKDEESRQKLKNFLWKYIKWQLVGLPLAASLDRKAYAAQKMGAPVYCQDVPPIDPLARDVDF